MNTFLSCAWFFFFFLSKFFKVPPFCFKSDFCCNLLNICCAVSGKHLTQRGKTDPPGLTAGLARTGTVSEGGHSGLKSTDSAVGSDHKKSIV